MKTESFLFSLHVRSYALFPEKKVTNCSGVSRLWSVQSAHCSVFLKQQSDNFTEDIGAQWPHATVLLVADCVLQIESYFCTERRSHGHVLERRQIGHDKSLHQDDVKFLPTLGLSPRRMRQP